MADEDLFRGVNRVKDPGNLSDIEKKHIPTIDAPDSVGAREPFEVVIHVGKELAHPDEGAHHIQWVELFAGDAFLARADFTPTVSGSPVTFTLKLNEDTTLRALARCNLHGVWESERPLKVGS
jgi:superoxide reductase